MDAELRGMVMAFRVAELQALLGFAGKNKSGRKNELQARCLEMVKSKSPPIVMKIKDLYRSIQMSNYGQPYSGLSGTFGGYAAGTTASSLARGVYSEGKYGQESGFGKSIGYQRVISGDGQCRTVPICPDVKLKELPFYDIQAVLIRPTSLINQPQSPKQEVQHSFCLSPSQAAEISGSREVVLGEGTGGQPISKVQYTVQVQLRFCALDSTEEQDDLFPPNLVVKVNGRLISLPQPIPSNRPGVEPKRPSKPLNITNNVKCCPHSTNTVHVQWVTDNVRNYAMSIYMVKRLTADELFQRLKNKRIQPADFTRGRIKEITSCEEEDLCAPTSISVSVACPLGKNRMTYPCRATTCKHLQCFDANLFLLMNEKKPTFICPVCNKRLKFDDLSIDGYFMDVIHNLSFDAGNEIELFPDGHWEPVVKIVKSEPGECPPPTKRLKPDSTQTLNNTIDLDDEICILEEDVKPEPEKLGITTSRTTSQAAEPEIIDLLSSDEEEEVVTKPSSVSVAASSDHSADSSSHRIVQQVLQHDNDDDEEEDEDVGIRPRRRKPRINYVEESSSDSSTANEGVATKSRNAQGGKSPACIDLSDSPASSPENSPQRRAFSSVSSHSSRSSSTSTHMNNRSGSGTSTLYSSSATTTNPVGIGHNSDGRNIVQTPPSHPSFRSTNFQTTPPPSLLPLARTSNVFSANTNTNSSTPSLVPSSSTSSSLFFSSRTQIPGYPSYDPRANWQADLNSYVNSQLNQAQMDLRSSLDSFDYNSYFNNPNYHLGFDPRGGGAGGGGFGSWM